MNHSKVWKSTVREHLEGWVADARIALGYKSFEYGEVYYNQDSKCFEIHCSRKVVLDKRFQEKIMDEFYLRGCGCGCTFIHDPNFQKS